MEAMGANVQRLRRAFLRRARGLEAGLTRWPDRRGWLESLALAATLAAVATPLAFSAGLLGPVQASGAVPGPLRSLAAPFLAPGLLEEALFRGLLLPHPRASGLAWRARLPWWLGSLALYLALHPLVALLLRPAARGVFDAPAFLVEAGLLGVVATALYERTGSLWPGVLLHGAVVAAWLRLGGAQLLGLG